MQKFLVPKKLSLCLFHTYDRLDGLVQKSICLWKMPCLMWTGFWIQSVLSILLSRQTKKQKVVLPLCKWRQHTWRHSLFENYELNFRPSNEVSTTGLENVCRVGICMILYVWVCVAEVAQIASCSGSNVLYQSQCTGCLLNWIHHWFQLVHSHTTTLITSGYHVIFKMLTRAEVLVHSTWECHCSMWCILTHTWI